MERLDLLVRQVRDQTGNQQYSATQGIRQREFVRYANDAQMRIYNKILMERSTLYLRVGYMDVEANDAVYTLATDIFLKHNILKVDYSQNGDARNYSPLTLRSSRQEVSSPGHPDSYFLRHGEIVLSPIPTQAATNGLRLNYQYTLPTLDIRRAKTTGVAMIGATATAWSAVSTGTVSALNDIATDGTGFMAVGATGTAVYSATGTSFANGAATGFGASGVNAVVYGNNRWVIGGVSANVAVSFNNGSTWTAQSGAFTVAETVYDIAYGDGTFVVCGTQGNLYTGTGDTDLTWTSRTSGFGTSFIAGACWNADSSTFVVVGASSKVATSTDAGVTWTLLTTNLPASLNLQKVVYNNGVYLTISDAGRLFRSADATTWAEIFAGQSSLYSNLSLANDMFFVGGSNGPTYVSFNGVDWTTQNIGNVGAVAGAPGLLIATLGSSATTLYSIVPTTLIGLSLDSTSMLDETNSDLENDWVDYISLVDKQGTQIASGIEILTYDDSEYSISVSPVAVSSTALETAMYICFGTNSSTHSQLPDVAERYLTEYMAMRIQMRDSNVEAVNQSNVLNELETEIIDSIANLEEDLISIAILDSSMMNYDEGL